MKNKTFPVILFIFLIWIPIVITGKNVCGGLAFLRFIFYFLVMHVCLSQSAYVYVSHNAGDDQRHCLYLDLNLEVGAENQTLVLFSSSTCSLPLSHLSSLGYLILSRRIMESYSHALLFICVKIVCQVVHFTCV